MPRHPSRSGDLHHIGAPFASFLREHFAAILPRGMPHERQALAYTTILKQLGVCAIVSTMHARSTAT